MHSGRKHLLSVTVLILLMTASAFIHNTDTTVHGAVFSGPLEDFIKEGKRVKVILEENLAGASFVPREDVGYLELIEQKSGRLQQGELYQLRIGEGVETSWSVQVFASAGEAGAEKFRDKLLEAGYEDPYLVRAEGLFKVRLGQFAQESPARKLAEDLRTDGWSAWVVSEPGKPSGEINIQLYNSKGRLIVSGRGLRISGSISLAAGLYPGETEFTLLSGGIRVSNISPFPQVLMGMLAGKSSARAAGMADTLPVRDEARKALAVIVRTELLYQLTEGSGSLFEPAYQGMAGVEEAVRRAVTATTGEILSIEGKPAPVEYDPVQAGELAEGGADYRTILKELHPGKVLLDLSGETREEILVEATVFSGLKYREISQLSWWGPRLITILELDLESRGFLLEPVLAGGRVKGLGDLNQLVREHQALAGINGGFYSYTGTPLGLLIKDGVMISEPIRARAAFGITGEGKILIDRVDWRGYLIGEKGKRLRVNGVNRPAGDNEVIVFNHYYAEQAPALREGCLELIMLNNRIEALNEGPSGEGSIIPRGGMVIQAAGNRAEDLLEFVPGSLVQLEHNFLPDWEGAGVEAAVGAGPLLLKEGRIWITTDEEGFQADISSGRAPRSALGVTADHRLIIVTVDGRQPESSIGMTLQELAEFLLRLGVEAALNLDGGSSARMVVRGFTMNTPSRERLLSNGLLIKNSYAR